MSEYIIKTPNKDAKSFVEKLCIKSLKMLGYQIGDEVIRCRECIHYKTIASLGGFCMAPDGGGGFKNWSMNPNGFCSDATKMRDE